MVYQNDTAAGIWRFQTDDRKRALPRGILINIESDAASRGRIPKLCRKITEGQLRLRGRVFINGNPIERPYWTDDRMWHELTVFSLMIKNHLNFPEAYPVLPLPWEFEVENEEDAMLIRMSY